MSPEALCEQCGTDHDGYLADTMGAHIRCLRLRAEQIGAVHVVDGVNAVEAFLTEQRDEFLMRYFADSHSLEQP